MVLGGADKGTVHVEGPTNAEAIKPGDPMTIPDLKGTYKPGASGKSTLSPGVLTVKALGTTTTCTPTESEVSLTPDASQQASGASGGSAGSSGAGGTSGTTSGGGLAETGAESDGALKASARWPEQRCCWAARCSRSCRDGAGAADPPRAAIREGPPHRAGAVALRVSRAGRPQRTSPIRD